MKILEFIKDLISPKKCYSCKKEWCFLCDKCQLWIKKFDNNNYNFDILDKYFDEHFILFRYKWELIQKIIRDWKYNHRKDIFEDLWIILAKEYKKNVNIDKHNVIVISSPMHFFKKLIRWFNQAEIIWNSFSKYLWLNHNNSIIKKNKQTKSQTKFWKEDRQKNIIWVFSFFNLENVYNKEIILVDDVITTGSTLNEISKVLKEAWVKKITVLSIASQ